MNAIALGTVAGFSPIFVSAQQTVSINGTNTIVTIPLPTQFQSDLQTFVTLSTTYNLVVPSGNPLVGAFVPNSGTSYQQNSTGAASYQVDVQSSCAPPVVRSGSAVNVTSGSTATVPTIALTGCPPA